MLFIGTARRSNGKYKTMVDRCTYAIFWRIISLTNQLLADCNSTIYADDIFAPNVTNEIQHHGKIVAWTYSGDIFFLDKNIYLIKK